MARSHHHKEDHATSHDHQEGRDMRYERFIRAIAIGGLLWATAGCTSPAAIPAASMAVVVAPSPAGSSGSGPSAAPTLATPSSSPAPSASETSPPSPTTAPTTSPTASPTIEPDPLLVTWKRGEVSGLDDLREIRASATDGSTMLLLGSRSDPEYGIGEPALWRSTDGQHWDQVLAPASGSRISAVTAGGPGFVAVGSDEQRTNVWTSTDGRSWSAVDDPTGIPVSLWKVAAVRDGLIAFGRSMQSDSMSIWTSPDGRAWSMGDGESELAIARGIRTLASHAGRTIAFVGRGDSGTGPIDVWSTEDLADWRKVATLPKADDVFLASSGDRGWVAIGDGKAWYSDDGDAWHGPVVGPDVAAAVAGDQAGFVVTGHVGSYGDETCGDQRPFHDFTWTSADGRTWQRMRPTKEFESAVIGALFVHDRSLIGIGGRLGAERLSDSFRAARWTSPLPDAARGDEASDGPSKHEGCGG